MRIIFEKFAKFYNVLFTFFENLFYKKFNTQNDLEKNGFIILKNELSDFIDFSSNEIISTNKYLKKIIFSDSQLKKILFNLFIKEKLYKKITNLTGFNYSIDFLIAYKTLPILDNEKSKGWYANKLHNDKPFTKNTLKIIIPLENIEKENGPMEILNKNESTNFNENNFYSSYSHFIGTPKDIFIFKPNLCLHRAGIPDKNKYRKQIMLQLNPSSKWLFNKSIYKFQKIREPKFPFISYFFDKKEKLTNIK